MSFGVAHRRTSSRVKLTFELLLDSLSVLVLLVCLIYSFFVVDFAILLLFFDVFASDKVPR